MKRLALVLLVSAVSLMVGLAGAGCSDAASPETTPPTSPAQTAAPAAYVTVDVNTAYEQLSLLNEAAQIVDVREPAEWAATGVPVGAVLISLGQLQERAEGELAKDKPVYVICNSGNRSRVGAQTLIDLGYGEVYNVDGGIQAWLAAGLPVEYQP